MYGSARKSKLQFFVKIQITALRLATGTFRPIPGDALQMDTCVMLLNLCRDMQNIIQFYKIVALPQHLNYDLVRKDDKFSKKSLIAKRARSQRKDTIHRYRSKCSAVNIPLTPPWTIKTQSLTHAPNSLTHIFLS